MTRGQDGSLPLSCVTLSFTTPRRFIPAHATGGKLFIYQSLVLIAGHSFGVFDSRDVLRVGAFFLLVQSFVILLLAPLYWPLLGIN